LAVGGLENTFQISLIKMKSCYCKKKTSGHRKTKGPKKHRVLKKRRGGKVSRAEIDAMRERANKRLPPPPPKTPEQIRWEDDRKMHKFYKDRGMKYIR
jgi:hypothetical protein